MHPKPILLYNSAHIHFRNYIIMILRIAVDYMKFMFVYLNKDQHTGFLDA